MFALIDGNNFYVSCERVFQPELINQPVIVLSNNDGCIISRSNEAKEMGLKMGEPLFKAKQGLNLDNIHIRSSNYPLYADMSNRMMSILANREADIEIYSIDEAFLYYPNKVDLKQEAVQIKKIVQQWLGLPVSVGIGPTKTLAKAANYLAKQKKGRSIITKENLEDSLRLIPVQKLWGIGRKHAKRCQAWGMKTALDYKNFDSKKIKKYMHLPGERLQLELRGIVCHDIQTIIPAPKTIVSSRSFQKETDNEGALLSAVISNIDHGIEKRIKKKCSAGRMIVFLQTHQFKQNHQMTHGTVNLDETGDGYSACIKHAEKVVKKIIKPKTKYKKSGIIFCDLYPSKIQMQSLFHDQHQIKKDQQLTGVINKVKQKWGKKSLLFAQQAIKNESVKMRQQKKSKPFTTSLDQLLAVK